MSAAASGLAALTASLRPGVLDALRIDASLVAGRSFEPMVFEAAFAGAGRRLGTAPASGDATVADAHGRRWSIVGWGLDEIGRAVLLLEGAERIPADEQPGWVETLYRTGALREQQAIVRALALLPDPARFVAIALDACRTSTQPIFEAVACENPYPAAHFAADAFNQLVLKAVFTEVPLARILGLESRITPELARMAADYAAERAAAGRIVPADLAILTGDRGP